MGFERGNPLSLLLLLLIMEVLSRMLKNIEMHAFIHVFRVGSNMAEGWSIYHLLFADDTILLLRCFKVGIRQ